MTEIFIAVWCLSGFVMILFSKYLIDGFITVGDILISIVIGCMTGVFAIVVLFFVVVVEKEDDAASVLNYIVFGKGKK